MFLNKNPPVLRVHLKKKKGQRGTYLMMLMRCFFFVLVFFSDFLYKSICFGYSIELHRRIDAVQMGTHNIYLYKEVNKYILAAI